MSEKNEHFTGDFYHYIETHEMTTIEQLIFERDNAVRLMQEAEPSSLTLLAIGAFGLALKHRTSFRRRTLPPLR